MSTHVKVKKQKTVLFFGLYLLGVFLSIALWWPFSEEMQYLEASTFTTYFALSLTGGWITLLSLFWMLSFIVSLIVTFIIAWWKSRYTPFLVVVAADLFSTIGLVVYSIATSAGFKILFSLFFNFALRLLVFLLLKKRVKEDTAHVI